MSDYVDSLRISYPLRLSQSLRLVDIPVVLIAFGFLAFGFFSRQQGVTPDRQIELFGKQVQIQVPSGWVVEKLGTLCRIHPPMLGEIAPTLEIRHIKADTQGFAPTFMDIQMTRIEKQRADSGSNYRILQTEDKKAFGTYRSLWSHFAIVRDPPGMQEGAAVLPVVIQGVDILVMASAQHAFHVTASAPSDLYQRLGHAIHEGISNIRIRGE